jgi:integrase
MEFLSENDFKFLFNSALEIEENDQERTEKKILKLILLFSYNFLFEQRHLFNLQWGDIDLKNRTIKNSRYNIKDLNLDEFEMNTEIYELVTSVYGILGRKDNEYIFESMKHDKNAINNLLGILNGRQKNFLKISSTVNLQKVIRSRIVLDLINSEGKSLINFYKIFGLTKDTQLTTAIKEYLALEKSRMANDIR